MSGARILLRPVDDMLLELVELHTLFADRSPPHGNAGLMYRFRTSRHEMVPPVEIASLFHQTIGATRRQPADFPNRA